MCVLIALARELRVSWVFIEGAKVGILQTLFGEIDWNICSPIKFVLNKVVMVRVKFIGGFIALGISISGYAELLHHYVFDPGTPYADSVGGADLVKYGTVGTITSDFEGFLSYSGTVKQEDTVYLGGNALNSTYDPFVLSLWFRVPTATGQSDYTSLFSSNEGTTAGFQIHFYDGFFGVNMNGEHLEVLPLAQLTTNEWHLVTIMQNPYAAEQGQVWLDGNVYEANVGSFGELNTFRLGVNRSGKQGFEGDMAEVSIYNDEVWDATRQAEAFTAGPVVPEPAVMSLILLSGIGSLVINRLFT